MVPSLLLSTLSLPTFRGIPFSPKPTKERKKKNDKLTNLETRVNKMKHFFNVQVHEQNQSLLGSGYIRFAPASSCGGGLGMMLSYVRTLLFFSFATNLTYVHSPLTLTGSSKGDHLFSPGMHHRLLHPGYYNATLHNLLGALDEYGVPAKSVCVHIFSQGPTQWFRREGFLNMLDGTGASTTLWAGNPNSTVDDILHLARSDVLVMGRSTMSVAVATLSSGVVILNGWDIKYPHEFIHAVPWRRDGSGKRDELLHQLKAADHANGIQQRRRRASEQKI